MRRSSMDRDQLGWRRVGTAIAIVAIVLSACKASAPSASGGGAAASGGAAAASAPPAGSAGTVNLAVNPWVGYEADAAVVSYILSHNLGYTVNKKNIVEQVSWEGFGTGEVDAILENWGHEDLKQKFITDQKVAVEVGSTGRKGIIGWFVPQWMADKYPDITDYKNLNKYADMFKTSESGDKGQLLDGDPSYVTNDVALVQNLNLNFKVVQGGSEATLITSLQQAQTQQKPLLAYFYSPQWALHDLKLAQVHLPPYTAGCDADPKKVACDYPEYDLDKVASKKFADTNNTAFQFIKNFQWTNDDQNVVAGYIARDGMSDDDAAKKWIDANPDKVAAWLPK
jgi:glycine betaine/proline transport system substrate-binding protein